jgi:outer membrane protein assembly factor BamD
MSVNFWIIILIIVLNLGGCSSTPVDETKDWSPQRLYSEAKHSSGIGDYTTAIKYYELLEARFPLGILAQQAHLDMIYAYYKNEEPESALAEAERFIKLYPRHSHIDYVYYLKGIINFNYDSEPLDRLLPLDKSQRDQSSATRAFQNFSELIRRFPNSRYNEDARQRMVFLRNSLAEYELQVAEFYFKRSAYVAAVNRAKKVVESYQQTPAVPSALVILAKSYKIMGMEDLSTATLKVLKLNYPNHEGITEIEQLIVEG